MRPSRPHFLPTLLALASGLAACASPATRTLEPQPTEQPAASPSPAPSRTPFHAGLYPTREPGSTLVSLRQWADVLRFTPFPYSTPLPPDDPTSIDGLYALFDASEPQWYRCARCADFRPAGGNWLLQFDGGVMRLYYEVSGFATDASFTVEGDRLFLFNDPHCLYDVGEYTWELGGQGLVLSEVHDECAIHLRAVNLTRQPWLSCAVAEEAPPPGCEVAE